MIANERDKTLALAGVFQSAVLAQQLARRGYPEEEAFHTSVRSILITDAESTEAVFGGVNGLALGLRTMRDRVATSGEGSDFEIARYVLSLAQLNIKLKKHQTMMRYVSERIESLKEGLGKINGEGFSNELYAALAQLYKETLSTLKPQIIVQGEHGNLANPLVVDKVRATLLAGVRAAFLWDQLGGRRWHLIFARKTYLSNAQQILADQP